MSRGMTREQWYEHLKVATQEEKDTALFFAAENLQCEQVEALIKAGAKVNGGNDMFGWMLRRTEDVGIVNAMLSAGWNCKTARYEDVWFFYDSDDKAEAYKTFKRMFENGFPDEERYKIAATVLKRGEFEYLDACIVHPGEDMTRLSRYPSLGRREMSATPSDKRDVTSEDIEKYVAWHNSIQDLYAAHFSQGIEEKKLNETLTADGMTGLMLALRAGKADAVEAFYRSRPDLSLDAGTALREDRFGQSAVSLLGQRDELQRLFAADFWRKAPEDALELLERVPQLYRAQLDEVEIASNVADARRAKIAAAKAETPKA